MKSEKRDIVIFRPIVAAWLFVVLLKFSAYDNR